MKTQNAFHFSIVACVSLFAFLFAVEQVYNYDIWWHLKTGRWILENRQILRTDPFSFSTYGASWINKSWLAGLFYALIEQHAGLTFLIIIKAVLIGAAFGGACLFLVRKGVNPYLAAFLLGYAVVIARFRFLLRPQMFMFLAVIILFWSLAETASREKKTAFFLVPLTILWVNLHGSAYLAPVFGAFLFCEKTVQWLLHSQRPFRLASFPFFSLILAVSLLIAVLATPFGLDLPHQILERTLYADLITRSYSVEEHLPLAWGRHTLYWALLITTALSFVFNWRNKRLFYILVFLGSAWFSLSSVRYVGLAALILSLLLCLNMQSVSDKITIHNLPFIANFQHILFPLLLAAAAIWSFNQVFTPSKVYQWGLGINESRYPVQAVNYLREKNFSGNIFNSWQDGGYILWNLPGAKTFIDGRCLPAQLKLYDELQKMDLHGLQSYLDRNNVRAALILKEEKKLYDLFSISPRYTLAYFDDRHLLFLRRDYAADLNETGTPFSFKYIQPQAFDLQYLVPLAKSSNAPEVEQELRMAVARNPEVFSLALQLAVFLDIRNRPEAVDYYIKSAHINPSLGFSHYELGVRGGRAALKHQRWKEAVEILHMTLKYGKASPETHFLLGNAYYQLKEFDNAKKAFNNSINMKPDNPLAFMNLGYVYIDTAEFSEAGKYFQKAIRLMPNLEGAHYGYALSLQRSGDKKAQTAWRTFIDKFPDSKWAQKARGFLDNSP